jgi:hypothetical protein
LILWRFIKGIAVGLGIFAIGVVFYLAYIHLISLLDPILTIVVGGAFWLAILAGLWKLIVILKDIVMSIFSKKEELDERGFKKF